jgi:hypothetical protein
LPALALVVALAAVAAVVWTNVLGDVKSIDDRVRCPAAPTGAGLVAVPRTELYSVEPLPPANVAVRVRNSTDRHRLATRVAARLELLGFAQAAPPDNDAVYPTGAMRCVAQIRYGPEGRAAAHTVNLVAPCAQLVADGRSGNTVDLVLGTDFFELSPTSAAREVLDALRGRTTGQPSTGGLQSLSGAPIADTAPLPTSALARAHRAVC